MIEERLVRAGEVPLTVKEGEEMVPLLRCETGLLRAGAPLPIGST